MATSTVNVSFQTDLLTEIDKTAAEEYRTRSELIREAARQYIDRKKRWQNIFSFDDKHAKTLDITQNDIMSEIKTARAESRTEK